MWYCLCVVVVVQWLSCIQLIETPLTAACQAPLSLITSWSLLKLIGIIPSGISVSWFMEGKSKQEAVIYYFHLSGCVRQKDVLLKSSCKHIIIWSFTKHTVTFSARQALKLGIFNKALSVMCVCVCVCVCIVVLSRSCVRILVTPWTAAHQTSLFLQHLPESAQIRVYWVSHDIQPFHSLWPPSLALSLPQHQGLSKEFALHIRWPRYWSFRFSISPSGEYSVLIPLQLTGLILLCVCVYVCVCVCMCVYVCVCVCVLLFCH